MKKLGDYILLNPKENISKGKIARKIAMENLKPFTRDINTWSNISFNGGSKFRNGDTLLARITPCLENGKTAFVNILGDDEIAYGSTEFYVLRAVKNKMDPYYLYYLTISKKFRNTMIKAMTGTSGRQRVPKEAVLEYLMDVPDFEGQKKIGEKLKVIDDKITLNNQINDNLDALLTNIFKKYMINDDFEKSNLTQIANYKNGLAMQKYRPNSNEESLPVLKIKELNQGNTDDSSDRCSANLDNSVIVNTGDIIFSWSGTLLVKNWTGDKVGLNQHLFKVTSNKYPAWFIYEWTKYHLLRFQAIAAGKATTMGHIKRSDLKSSPVYIPSQLFLEKMDSQLAPIYSQRLNLIKENQQLSKLKQTLLNKYF